jgi:hypothetical protein
VRYASAIELRVTHGYTADGSCRAFSFAPSPETAARIRGLRGTLRARPDGFCVLLPLDAQGRPLVSGAAVGELRFTLRLLDAELPLYTDLGTYRLQDAPLFSGTADPGGAEVALALGSASAHGEERRSVPAPGADVALALAGRPRPGARVEDFELSGSGVSALAYAEATRQLRVDARQAPPGATFVVRYPTRAALESGTFAQVVLAGPRLLPASSEPLGAPRRFVLELAAKRVRWVYYCVTDLEPQAGALRVLPPAGAAEGAPSFGAPTELGAQHDTADPIARGLAVQHPTLRRVRLVSEAVVACRETPRLLELHQGDVRVRGPLANPSLRSFARIALGADAGSDDVMFEIVRHLRGSGPAVAPGP